MYTPPTDQPIQTIEKEDIPNLKFPPQDVLADSPPERERRRADAERASRLGNAYHGKLDIFFQTADGQSGHHAPDARHTWVRLLLGRSFT
jgi:hypothetical protein